MTERKYPWVREPVIYIPAKEVRHKATLRELKFQVSEARKFGRAVDMRGIATDELQEALAWALEGNP